MNQGDATKTGLAPRITSANETAQGKGTLALIYEKLS